MGRWDYSWRLSFFNAWACEVCGFADAVPDHGTKGRRFTAIHRIRHGAALSADVRGQGRPFSIGGAYKDWAAEAENAARSVAG